MRLSLVLPAHNEANRLPGTVRAYAQAFRAVYGSAFELIAVANGSTDQTAARARDLRSRFPELEVVEIAEPIGKGGAVLAGFRLARGERVLFADADGATAAESLLMLADQLEHFDVVIGSRRLTHSQITRRQPYARRLLGHAFAFSTRLMFGLPFRDTQCGAKAFRHDAAKEISLVVHERRWLFDVDMLLAARALGLSVAELPVVWQDKEGSRLQVLPAFAEVARSLWRLRRRWQEPDHTLEVAGLRRRYSTR